MSLISPNPEVVERPLCAAVGATGHQTRLAGFLTYEYTT